MPEPIEFAISLRSFKAIAYRFHKPDDALSGWQNPTFRYELKTFSSTSELTIDLGVMVQAEGRTEPEIELTTRSLFTIKNPPLNENSEPILPASVMLSLIRIAYASTRGILAEKTAGTVVMPLQNIAESFSDELKGSTVPTAVY